MKSKLSNTEVIAYIFMGCGIILFFSFLFDFYSNNQWFFIQGTLSDLGTILSGTAGVLFAFSGVLLFFAALKYQREDLALQRQELSDTRAVLRDQSETIKLQTYETTFFRLIDNHVKLVSSLTYPSGVGHEGLGKYCNHVKGVIQGYKKCSIDGFIYMNSAVERSPEDIVSDNFDTLKLIANNVSHITKLIRTKLKDDIFYHETFFNSMTIYEKYFLGLFSYCGDLEFKNKLRTNNFNYLEYFENSDECFYDPSVNLFVPYIYISIKNGGMVNVTHVHLKSDLINESFFCFSYDARKPSIAAIVRLINVELNWKTHGDNIEKSYIIAIRDAGNVSEGEVNLNELFDKTIVDDYLSKVNDQVKLSNVIDYSFSLVFHFAFGDRILLYRKNFTLGIRNMTLQGSVWSISQSS